MKKLTLVMMSVLFALTFVFCFVSCSDQAKPAPEPEKEKYVVTFDSQGGSSVASSTVTEGTPVAKPADPTYEGFVFKGWYKEPECTNAYDFNAAVTQALTLYAKWADPVYYTVTFDTQGGSAIEPVSVLEGSRVAKPADPTKEYCTFQGWYKDAKCETAYKFTDSVTGPITLYAKWYTTRYFMAKGWKETVTTPMWTSKDAGTVEVPDAVLEGDAVSEITNVTPELKAALAEALADPDYFKDVKNVIIIISDGMGITHVRASEQWSGELIMTQLPNIGRSQTLTREGIITDSAAGGNALSTGYKTTILFAAVDAEGNNLKSISEYAREKGKLVGIVTNAQLEDATPAVYSVHNKNRSQGWTKMAQQQVVFGADLFMGNDYGGYAGYFDSNSDLYPFVEANNMELFSTAKKIVDNVNKDIRMWAIFPATANKFARFDTTSKKYPNLQQMTAYALTWLDSHADDDKGFVVMIENTYTDHFGHGNNPLDGSDHTYGIVKEVQSTDEAVAIALKYVLEHPDTALIVTADHETGNTQLREGWETDFSQIKAPSGSHSEQDVPVFAIGKGTEALNSLSAEAVAAGKKWYEATAYENAVVGQVIGSLISEPGDDQFGGDINTDSFGKTSPKFEITVNQTTNTLTYTLDLTGVPIKSGNLVQFKIKPASSSNSIKVELKGDPNNVTLLNTTVFSSTDGKTIKDDVIPPLMRAYKQAFITTSGFADGWYQFSVPATADSKQIIITLAGSFGNGTKIGMDDLTIQYATTIGELVFNSDKATAAGEPLVILK